MFMIVICSINVFMGLLNFFTLNEKEKWAWFASACGWAVALISELQLNGVIAQ